jgi:hypothetical protein
MRQRRLPQLSWQPLGARLLSARRLLLRLRLARPAGLVGCDVLLRPLSRHDTPPSPVGAPSLRMRRSRIRAVLVPGRLICAQVEISEPSLPEHRAVRSEPGDGDRERLPQPSQPGEGRAPMPSRQPEPPDRPIVAIPADDLPSDGVGDGRPGDAQLIARRAGQPQPIRACPRDSPGSGIARTPLPFAARDRLSAHAHASESYSRGFTASHGRTQPGTGPWGSDP